MFYPVFRTIPITEINSLQGMSRVLTETHFLCLIRRNREAGLPNHMLLCHLGCNFDFVINDKDSTIENSKKLLISNINFVKCKQKYPKLTTALQILKIDSKISCVI